MKMVYSTEDSKIYKVDFSKLHQIQGVLKIKNLKDISDYCKIKFGVCLVAYPLLALRYNMIDQVYCLKDLWWEGEEKVT